MKKQNHLLADIWERYPEAMAHQPVVAKNISVGQYLKETLALGPFYYYVITLADYTISHVHDNLLHLHGASQYPRTVQEIIDYIHPDDLDFVVEAEAATLQKMQEIGFEHQLLLKNSYCFRMKVADGTYHLFHHQAIHLSKDAKGGLATALNIHTDIHHITQVNNKIVLVTGIGGRTDYCQMDLSKTSSSKPLTKLTKREMEVLSLLAQGLSSQQIGNKIFISELTVRVHRKNLLKKIEVTNSGNLIKKSIELGLI